MRALHLLFIFIASNLLIFSPSASASGSDQVVVRASGGTLNFSLADPRLPYAGAHLIIAGPDGYRLTKRFDAGRSIFFNPSRDGAPINGRFDYELRLQAIEEPRAGMGMPQAEPIAFAAARGAFALDNGSIVADSLEEATRAIVVPDDQSVQGSLCVGLDCTSSEAFPDFSVLTLKENNLRIRFQDTSNSASFPSTDWELRANETTNGGANRFSIVDYDANNEVLAIEAGAPDSSILIDDQGQIGMGTSTPLLNLHIVDTNTPAMRLDQDGTGGFAAQSWDMGGNEVEYFVRDATALTVPFSIVAGAPTDSLVVDGMGRVGLGMLAPQADLHIRAPGGIARIRLESSDGRWDASTTGSGFSIDNRATSGDELRLSAGGDLRVAGSLTSLAKVNLPRVGVEQSGASLTDIEAYIERHGQLPGFAGNGAEGHDLIDFQMRLLEAVQQLTIQNIEQEKEIDALRDQISRMRR